MSETERSGSDGKAPGGFARVFVESVRIRNFRGIDEVFCTSNRESRSW